MNELETSVAIIGGGPSGLLLSQSLARAGIASCVLERCTRKHVEQRVRAGVLEQSTVDALCRAGVGERLLRECVVNKWIELRFGGKGHRIDFDDLIPGHYFVVYGQSDVVKDLINARLADGAAEKNELLFEVEEAKILELNTKRPVVTFSQHGKSMRLQCDWIAGCDGFHGVSRHYLPDKETKIYEINYPFAWLGILADVMPSTKHLIYASSERGFALHSMRTPGKSRLYLQVDVNEKMDNWSDEQIWEELQMRLETIPDWKLAKGLILQRCLTTLRSFVIEPMRYGKLFLAGDAAHIVPTTGAKGLNLAIADVTRLSTALIEWYSTENSTLLDAYSDTSLSHVWHVQNFSNWMTNILHLDPAKSTFEQQLRLAQLDQIATSRAAKTLLAENYVGIENFI